MQYSFGLMALIAASTAVADDVTIYFGNTACQGSSGTCSNVNALSCCQSTNNMLVGSALLSNTNDRHQLNVYAGGTNLCGNIKNTGPQDTCLNDGGNPPQSNGLTGAAWQNPSGSRIMRRGADELSNCAKVDKLTTASGMSFNVGPEVPAAMSDAIYEYVINGSSVAVPESLKAFVI